MPFWKGKEKPFKMIWRVEKNGKDSHLAGTAHFFPHSFRNSLTPYLRAAETVIIEGPLDPKSMEKVSKAGMDAPSPQHLFQLLDGAVIAGIRRALIPSGRGVFSGPDGSLHRFRGLDLIYEMVRGMKPWMAFFTIWTHYLESRGWKHSVDLEAYHLALELNKPVVFLETIEEQIEVLETLSLDRIIRFLGMAHRWPDYVKEYAAHYLEGDLEKLLSLSTGFPSRSGEVIERRDAILFERMQGYLEKGGAVAFVGAPHVRGICRLLGAQGYDIRH